MLLFWALNDLKDIVEGFQPIGLGEIDSIRDSVKLLKRHDTKFVFPANRLGPLLERLTEQYRILEIDGRRLFGYENLYFDTEDYHFYRKHHNRKLNRYKFRYRQYTDSKRHYWEVKFKNNKRKTIKDRFEQTEPIDEFTEELKELTAGVLRPGFDVDLDLIGPRLSTHFSRITLASKELQERITIDVDIRYKNMAGQEKALEGVAVAELKQAKLSLRSPFIQAAKDMYIYRSAFSKYCTGIALLGRPAKIGRFKRRVLTLERLSAA